ncbi:UNVERIFIED_CONTAM: hypothetical protein Sradi_7190000 [Sesamum radiatum]|uniref:Uncharacterized protein n=1 Tax=Sesamum radiatum TaxID=300843 RepID=A0AAW2IQV8_SESRA
MGTYVPRALLKLKEIGTLGTLPLSGDSYEEGLSHQDCLERERCKVFSNSPAPSFDPAYWLESRAFKLTILSLELLLPCMDCPIVDPEHMDSSKTPTG